MFLFRVTNYFSTCKSWKLDSKRIISTQEFLCTIFCAPQKDVWCTIYILAISVRMLAQEIHTVLKSQVIRMGIICLLSNNFQGKFFCLYWKSTPLKDRYLWGNVLPGIEYLICNEILWMLLCNFLQIFFRYCRYRTWGKSEFLPRFWLVYIKHLLNFILMCVEEVFNKEGDTIIIFFSWFEVVW